MHAFITQICRDQISRHQANSKALKVARVNTTLLGANENKILQKFAEVIDLQKDMKEMATVEMIPKL